MEFEEDAVDELTELLFALTEQVSLDLCAFAQHANRKSVTPDDILLVCRRSPRLVRTNCERDSHPVSVWFSSTSSSSFVQVEFVWILVFLYVLWFVFEYMWKYWDDGNGLSEDGIVHSSRSPRIHSLVHLFFFGLWSSCDGSWTFL